MIERIITEIDALMGLTKDLYPNYQYISSDSGLITINKDIDDGIVNGLYTSNSTCPFTQVEIDAEVLRLQTEYNGLEYSRLRKEEYDKLNQDEMRFDDQRDNTTTWVDTINAIKAMFPKPV